MGVGTSAELAPDVAEKSLTADELLLQSLRLPENGDVAAWIRCLRGLLEDNRHLHDVFSRLWSAHVPRGGHVASRQLVREVLQRATHQLEEVSPSTSSQATSLVIEVLGGSSQPVSFDEAFQLFRVVLKSLQESLTGEDDLEVLKLDTTVLEAAAKNKDARAPHGASLVDIAAPKVSDASIARAKVLPNRPTTRSELESTNATLLAKLLAAHAAHDELLRKAEGLRGSLLHGAISQEMDLRGGEDLAELQHILNIRRMHVISLESALDRHVDRLNARVISSKHQRQELVSLREECSSQAERALSALQQRNEVRDALQRGRSEHDEMRRKAKHEQVRASMLRDVVEEQRRQSDAEQVITCRVAVLQVQSEEAQDRLVAEAEMTRLRTELVEARSTLESQVSVRAECAERHPESQASDVSMLTAVAAHALAESELHTVEAEMGFARKRLRESTAEARRRAADVSALRGELLSSRSRSAQLSEELRVEQARINLGSSVGLETAGSVISSRPGFSTGRHIVATKPQRYLDAQLSSVSPVDFAQQRFRDAAARERMVTEASEERVGNLPGTLASSSVLPMESIIEGARASGAALSAVGEARRSWDPRLDSELAQQMSAFQRCASALRHAEGRMAALADPMTDNKSHGATHEP
uniref:Uncharacterized protein n=1 Tax=Noctiluca scintillans TaxID=2966 RepID=A0A7S1ADJ7_NOCSC|mmetsp:Transcript_41821/g.110754  ORF Transcript_41821/g.110754 Transcript_41821/m.110754 type:complete len:647 (+) Transcript_41821:102-2042(+)